MMEGLWAMKDGMNAYFFRASESDCNGYAHHQIDSVTLQPYNCIGL
jgi:hypothetical protein